MSGKGDVPAADRAVDLPVGRVVMQQDRTAGRPELCGSTRPSMVCTAIAVPARRNRRKGAGWRRRGAATGCRQHK